MIPVRKYFRLLTGYLRPLWPAVLLLAALLLAGIALQLVNPQIVRYFIDTATSGGSRDTLLRAAALFLVFAVLQQVFVVAAAYLAEHVGWTATNAMRAELAEHCLRLDMDFHKVHTPGELIERIDGDVTALSNFFSQFIIQVLGNAVLLAGIVALLLRENAWIGLGLAVFAVAGLFGLVWIQAAARPLWRDVRARSAEYFGFLGEHLVATEDVRGNGAEDYVLGRSTGIHRAWLPEAVRARIGFAAMWSTTIVLFAGATSLVYGLGSYLFTAGTLSIGSVYLIFHYSEMMRHPIERIRTQMEDLQKAGAAIERVEELFALRPRLDRSGRAVLGGGALGVRFDDVEFSYPDDDGSDNGPALHGLSFVLAPGRVLGVLGRSGSGKTTLARLLTRLYDPGRGAVAVGDVALTAVEERSLRRRVAMVTQEVRLFRASVRDNLTFFDPTIGDERIWSALEDLGLDGWVRALPEGLDTVLAGDGGLSAGEGQLLAFGRVFLEDPGLVVLDEASSRLDPATEMLIERAVDRLLARRTGIIIAHRLATVERADFVLILEDGRIVEFGERARLAADPGSRLGGLLRTGMEEVLR